MWKKGGGTDCEEDEQYSTQVYLSSIQHENLTPVCLLPIHVNLLPVPSQPKRSNIRKIYHFKVFRLDEYIGGTRRLYGSKRNKVTQHQG